MFMFNKWHTITARRWKNANIVSSWNKFVSWRFVNATVSYSLRVESTQKLIIT